MRKLTNEEITNILAGLRLLQRQGGCDYFADTDFEQMDDSAIDRLCEELNCGGDTCILGAEPIELSESDWTEIYYAVEYKKTSPALEDHAIGGKRESRRWMNQLNSILKKIGPDGQYAAEQGVITK